MARWRLDVGALWLRCRAFGGRCRAWFKGCARAFRYMRLKNRRRQRDRKTIPLYEYCKNCGSELHGMYCHRCGQYALDVNQTFGQYIKQFFENTYQYDGRMMATFRALFASPGKLTNEFVKGRMNSYMQPLKLYMFMSLILFSFVLLLIDDPADSKDKGQQRVEARSVVSDSVGRVLRDTVLIDMYRGKVEAESLTDDMVSRVAAQSVDLKKDAEKQEPVDEDDKQKEKVLKARIKGMVQNNVPIVMMFLIPLYALIVRFQYRKKNRKYLDCFVYALHNSTMLLVFMSLAIVLDSVNWSNVWTIGFLYVLLLIYMAISARNVFEIGWFRSSIKTLLGFHLYMIICTLLLTIYFVIWIVVVALVYEDIL